jgi:two-component system, NtrC family, sensor histidine kinase HydH
VDPSYDLRTRTTLVCGALALAIALSVLLRGRVRRVHLLGAAFAGDLGMWYLSQSLFGFTQVPVWDKLRIVLAVLLPVFAVNLFEGMMPQERAARRRMPLGYVTLLLSVPMVALALSPKLQLFPVRVAIFLYVFTLFAAGLVELYRRGNRSQSRATQRRVTFLVVTGALAGVFNMVDFVWVIGYVPAYYPPPVGVVISVVFLYLLAHALHEERLLDLYEMLGKLLVATAVGFLIGLVFYLLVSVFGPFSTMYLNAVLAAIVVLVLFNPLIEKTEQQIQRLVLRERRNLEKTVADARQRLVHVLELDQLGTMVMSTLERTRRVTAAALYLRFEDGTGFEPLASLGPKPPPRIEIAAARPLLEELEHGTVVLEELGSTELEIEPGRPLHTSRDALRAASAVLGPLRTGVVIGLGTESRQLLGLLVVADERIRDAFSPEDLAVLEAFAAAIGVVVENSRLYTELKTRDRLAVLGRMAAGLAHEIRNPLGAIKGAAQLLADPSPGSAELDEPSREFVDIILEEVERLDQVVGSVLDLARQSTGFVAPIDINAVVQRTVHVMRAEWTEESFGVEVEVDPDLPRAAIAPEQLQQVLMNLLRNAMEAMGGEGRARITTRTRHSPTETFVEVAVTDTGPGISPSTLPSIFMPFFTTKHDGTGLGLAISQRIVESSGGRIELRTEEGKGSTFLVVLPSSNEPVAATPTGAVLAQLADAPSRDRITSSPPPGLVGPDGRGSSGSSPPGPRR